MQKTRGTRARFLILFHPGDTARTDMKLKIWTKREKMELSLRSSWSGLSVGLGDTLQFVLLLDGVAVRAALGSVDQLIGQALSDGLDVAERGLPGSSAEKPDGLKEGHSFISQCLNKWLCARLWLCGRHQLVGHFNFRIMSEILVVLSNIIN